MYFFFSTRLSSSQPHPYIQSDMDDMEEGDPDDAKSSVWFSQPSNLETMLLSQISSTPGSSQVI